MPSDKTEVVLDDILRNVELAERFARDLTLEQIKIDMQVLMRPLGRSKSFPRLRGVFPPT
jgi:hypothetical protein